MDFDLTEEQSMLVASCDKLVAARCSFEARREQARQLPQVWPALWADLSQLGLTGIVVPEAFGGSARPLLDAMLVAQSLGRGWLLEPYVDCALAAVSMLTACEADATRDTALRSIASGHKIMVPSHRASWRDGTLVLEAHHACYADGVLTLLDDRLHLALTTGSRKVHWRQVDGTAAGRVRVPATSVFALAEGEAAHRAWRFGTQVAKLGRIAEGLGLARVTLELTAEYLRTRRQFGQPIGRFQALAHRMADALVALEQAGSLILATAIKLGTPEGVRSLDATQVLAHRALRLIGQEAVQLHGGIGMTDEYQVSHCVKRLLAIELEIGDVDMALRRIAATRGKVGPAAVASEPPDRLNTRGPATAG